MRQSLRMLLRDWRSGELRVLAIALVIAVASVSSVSFLGDRVARAIARDANQLLGADLVLLSDRPWSEDFSRQVNAAGLQSAEGMSFMSMAIAGEKTQLAGVKAVTENYPLRGRLRVAPRPGAQDAPAERARQLVEAAVGVERDLAEAAVARGDEERADRRVGEVEGSVDQPCLGGRLAETAVQLGRDGHGSSFRSRRTPEEAAWRAASALEPRAAPMRS